MHSKSQRRLERPKTTLGKGKNIYRPQISTDHKYYKNCKENGNFYFIMLEINNCKSYKADEQKYHKGK